jgi:hypothetical protein
MIDAHDIKEAQESWGRSLVEVGAADSWEAARARAELLIAEHYLLEDDNLLFCPTKAAAQQFRHHSQAALAYFVGRDSDFPEDTGFALEPWCSVRFENSGLVLRPGLGAAMGNYYFGRTEGSELKVEYSFVYVRDRSGAVKIQLHHSALPYGA